ncbi:MAG: hypothetical protein V4727_13190 [Verrucomicrobiota bacterium]
MKTLLMLFATMMMVQAAPKEIRVFIALCDNKTQGIVPVGAKIGNGDDADANLYWGCSDGFGAFFSKSTRWKVTESKKDVSETILRRLTLQHVGGDMNLVAEAYRGSQMKQCIKDFEAAACSNTYDLVAFIGHNGLMDFNLTVPKKTEGNDTEVMVLCCMSEKYFGDRLRGLGCRPVLMTQQLMYPGSFLLHATIEKWHSGGTPTELRAAAAAAYAKNQKISVKGASGVFAKLAE